MYFKIPSIWQNSEFLADTSRNKVRVFGEHYLEFMSIVGIHQEFIPVVLGDKNLPFNVSPSILRTYFAKRGKFLNRFYRLGKYQL